MKVYYAIPSLLGRRLMDLMCPVCFRLTVGSTKMISTWVGKVLSIAKGHISPDTLQDVVVSAGDLATVLPHLHTTFQHISLIQIDIQDSIQLAVLDLSEDSTCW